MTLCAPAERPAVAHVATRALPEPLNAAAPQPPITLPPSLKLTAPVGALPVTVAVNVTLAPALEGLGLLAIAVAVAAIPPPEDTCRVSALELAARTLTLMPYVASPNDRPTTSAASLNDDVAGVISRSCVSLLQLSQYEHNVSSGIATRICAPLFG